MKMHRPICIRLC